MNTSLRSSDESNFAKRKRKRESECEVDGFDGDVFSLSRGNTIPSIIPLIMVAPPSTFSSLLECDTRNTQTVILPSLPTTTAINNKHQHLASRGVELLEPLVLLENETLSASSPFQINLNATSPSPTFFIETLLHSYQPL